MAETDLRALMAEGDVARLLSRHELSTLRAAATGGARSVALLHGIPEAGAQRQIDAVKAKLEAARNGTPSTAGSRVAPGPASTPPTAQAPGPAEGSTAAAGAPAARRRPGLELQERVLGYLRDHSSARVGQMRKDLGVGQGPLERALRGLRDDGSVSRKHEGQHGQSYSLAPEGAAAADSDDLLYGPDGVTVIKANNPVEPPPITTPAGVTLGRGQTTVRNVMQEDAVRDAEIEAQIDGAGAQLMRYLGVSGSAVAPPKVFIGLWDVLLADGEDWTPEHTHAYVAAARSLYAAYGGPS